ncbi:hypothetical protein DM02DRAFT_541080 [Periconia macrospinosa]|uniref:Uncharacterized protein n=1 Tax=Periconia macrospinosa TaxID=97972 RepID=A0A2V1D6J6_9PLEO|nr:hypothetical protein DM02DRAFT_541080 [Periconia macrospinosa]
MSASTDTSQSLAPSSQTALSIDDTAPTTSPPRPGKTYIIRSRSTSKVITFLGGSVVLCPPGSLGTYRWTCVETADNWLGFQDPASGMYLGYDSHAWLQCQAKSHGEREYLAPRERPSGGFVLLVLVEGHVLPVGVRTRRKSGKWDASGSEVMEEGVKIREWRAEAISWDFVEV